MKIGKKEINDDDIYFIIEEGQANNSNFNKTLKMVELAFENGVSPAHTSLDYIQTPAPVTYKNYGSLNLKVVQ